MTFLRNALTVAFAAGILLAAVPASAQPHDRGGNGGNGGNSGYRGGNGGDRGGNNGGYRGGNNGGYRGGNNGGYRQAPTYNNGSYNGGYRQAPVYRQAPTYNNGDYNGGYRQAPVYRQAPTYNNGGYNNGYRNTQPRYNNGGYDNNRGNNGYRTTQPRYNNGGYNNAGYGRYGHRPVNDNYARYPNEYRGDWDWDGGNRWYNGYWYNYWANDESWLWWGGHYGFWFPFGGINVFVYEVSPDTCQYWDGYEWVPYYDPDTGYYCPY